MSNDTPELEILISIVKDKNNPLMCSVRDPDGLYKHLLELRDKVVGLSTVKESIASQTMHLMKSACNGDKNNNMLHTTIYGPPGVGKTKIGILLAKIWNDLGYIQASKAPKPRSNSNNGLNGVSERTMSLYYYVMIAVILLPIFEAIFKYSKWMGIVALIATTLICYIYLNPRSEIAPKRPTRPIKPIIKNTDENNDKTNLNENKNIKDDKNDSEDDNEDIIRVVSREDFVAGYLGQTAIKTLNLLEESRNKVLFIDESYSLMLSHNDSFGLEALTTLNKFMSEFPNDVIIIFAGYKDMMQESIFKAQPGLVRRCIWFFDCPPYSSDELVKIFKIQLARNGWTCKSKINKLFRKNIDLFPSYAGDTEKLSFYAQLEHTKSTFQGDTDASKKILTRTHIKKALERLKQNNIDNKPKTPVPPNQNFNEILKNLTR